MSSQTRWSSTLSFIFAASAAAIGLGNIWRFPYLVGQNGGSAFVLIYLMFVILLGIPLMIAEVAVGKMTHAGAHKALKTLAKQSSQRSLWSIVGIIHILSSFLILSYYTMISGWVLHYLVLSINGNLTQIHDTGSRNLFSQLLNNPTHMLITNGVIIGFMVAVNLLGMKKGLERVVMLMFPALLILLLFLLGVAMHSGQFARGIHFLFAANFSKINAHVIVLALGQAFFSLGIALGITILFGSYLPQKTPIISSVVAISIADTAIAILAGMVIFPIAFAHHLRPDSGPSLIFKTLPIAFAQLPHGQIFASIFFLMLQFAAFTSIIAFIEPFIHWANDATPYSREKICLLSGLLCWLLSIGSVTSFNIHKNLKLFGLNFYQSIDYLTANIMLPIGAILLAVFCGWIIKKELYQTHLNWNTNGIAFLIWQFVLRYIAPVGIGIVLIQSIYIM